MKFERQHIVFILVLGMLVISVVYRIKHPFVQREVDTLTFTGETMVTAAGVKKTSGLAAKEFEGKGVREISRFLSGSNWPGKVVVDLFALYEPPRIEMPASEVVMAAPEPVDTVVESPKPEPKPAKINPVPEIARELKSYRFCGTYQSKGTRSIFLTRGKQVLVASVGDRIYGKYLIEEIADDHIRLKALDLNETININIREFNDG
ncbi:MAG: hypothetical protein D3926_07105 [Desulfobacteraceae bacterium]|nr:MAG: hypothetical protein D3926_07105 [Desulfobacteraceae bacterium]